MERTIVTFEPATEVYTWDGPFARLSRCGSRTGRRLFLEPVEQADGQVNLVRRGLDTVHEGGVFTLTSGLLSREPTPGSVAISLVNAGVEGFIRAAALEMPREIRVNVVSPPWVAETLEAMGENPEQGLPAATVAEAYRKSLDGEMTGETIDARAMA